MEKYAKQLTFQYALLQGTYWISQCAIFSFAAVYLQYKNFNNTQIGLVFSLASLFTVIIQPIIAAFADKTNKVSLRQIIIMIMCSVLVLATILYVAPYSYALIMVIYVAINALQFTLNPLFNALAIEYVNKGIPINYGLARGTGSITFAVTSFILGFFINKYNPGFLLPFFIISYGFVILSAFMIKNKPNSSEDAIKSESSHILHKEKISNPMEDARNNESSYSLQKEKILKDKKRSYKGHKSETSPTGLFTFFVKYKKFTCFLVGIGLIYYSHNIISTYLINIIKNVGGNSNDLGISMAIAAALELPTLAAFIYIVRKVRCHTLIKVSAFFFLFKVIIAWIAPNVFMVHISQTMQMFSFALYTPASVYYVNSIIDEQDKVKGQSMLGVATLGVAGTIANITGGKLLDTLGVTDMLFISTVITFIGFIIVCFTTTKAEA